MEGQPMIVLAASHVASRASRPVTSHAASDAVANFVAAAFSSIVFVLGFVIWLFYMIFILAIMLSLYLLPTILAIVLKRKDNLTLIVLLNVLAGWTFVGWIAALVFLFVDLNRADRPA
jgi:uncharacterized membrane protein